MVQKAKKKEKVAQDRPRNFVGFGILAKANPSKSILTQCPVLPQQSHPIYHSLFDESPLMLGLASLGFYLCPYGRGATLSSKGLHELYLIPYDDYHYIHIA